MTIKKIILAIAVSIFFISLPAQAVKLAPVNVPESGPLQPIPEGVEPNIKSNIQDKSKLEDSGSQDNNSGQAGSLESEKQGEEGSNIVSSAGVSKNNFWLWAMVLIIFVILLVSGLMWYRKLQSKKQ